MSDRLWAPWRLAYVAGDDPPQAPAAESLLPGADPACFLCQGAAWGVNRAWLVVAANERCLTVLNRYPYNNGHLLVAPARHKARLDELDADEQLAVHAQLAEMIARLERAMRPAGFNLGVNLGRVAGAGLPGHLHWHIVPRWDGDTNFMPAVAATKVIPQALDELWELLTK